MGDRTQQTMTNLQHIGGDRWRYRMFIGYRPDGSQRTRSKAFRAPDEKTAKRLAKPIAAALETERDQQLKGRGSMAELAEDWLAFKRQQGRSPKTLDGYQGIVAAIVKRFGTKQVKDMSGRDIDRWYGELLGEMTKPKKDKAGNVVVPAQLVRTPSTVQHYHSVLRGMLRQAEKWELTTTVATRRATPPEVVRREMTPPTTAVLELLFADAGTGEFANMVRLSAATGMRAGELCALKWGDITANTLQVRQAVIEPRGGGWLFKVPKGKRARKMTIGPDVLDVLVEQQAHIERMCALFEVPVPAPWLVFPDLRADLTGRTPRRPRWVSHLWIVLRDRHGVTFRLHDLRHWNATTMLNAGVPMATVSARLGHQQESTTRDIYSHVGEGTDETAAQVLTGLMPRRGLPAA